jgi:pyochelin synthetase
MINKSQINVEQFVARLGRDGVVLWEEDGKLRYRAPQGMLAEGDLRIMKANKAELLQLLKAATEPALVAAYPESRYEPFPLTDVQSAYLLGRGEVFEYGGVACHIYLELDYPELELGRAEKAWNRLVARHDMLRAIINRDGSQQVMAQTPRLEVAYTDARDWEAARVAVKLAEVRAEMGDRIYQTDRWPLFGVAVTQAPDRAVLHLSIEFLIADWASIWRLLAEFETLYYDPERILPDLQLSFRDYLLAERSLRESAAYLRDQNYWTRRIDALPAAPDLPLARPRNESGRARFVRQSLRLDPSTWKKFKQKTEQRGLTPTAAVLTAYAAVIGRWSRSGKFCLNLTVLNRLPLHPQVNEIVGDFTAVSLLAVDWDADHSFRERARAINRQLFADLDHRLFSGIEVLRELSRRRGRTAALLPIVFTSAIGLATQQLQGEFTDRGISQTPQVFLDCQVLDGPFGLLANWDHREGVFPDGMTSDMFDAFADLLRRLAESEAAWEADEMIVLPKWQLNERRRVNATQMPLPKELLHSGIVRQAVADPRRPAVIDRDGVISYGELTRRAAAITAKLAATGCRRQDRVAIIMDKSVNQIVAVLGTLAAGAVYVPIDPAQPELRRAAMLEKTGVRQVLTDVAGARAQWPEKFTVIEADRLPPLCENSLPATDDPDLPAYIIHTSGSTGQPKGVVITHRAAVNTIQDVNRRFNIGRTDRLLGLAQLGFDLSVYDIFGILSVGGTLVLPSADRATDPSHWAKLLIEKKVTIWNSVPAMLQMLLAYLDSERIASLPCLRLALLSGDWIPLSLPDQLVKRAPNVRVVGLGGATEASIWSIFHVYQGLQSDWNSIPYGRPLANQRFRVLDAKMRDCPVWVPGELYITGVGLAVGYDGDQAATQRSFFAHPDDGERLYRTGDLGRYTPGGEIEFLGRDDNQVKIKGHRIELGEIEAALQQHPAVTAAVVVATGNAADRSLFAAVTLADQAGMSPSLPELMEFLAQRLPASMIPAVLRVVATLPLTPNGKIDRNEIAKWRVQSVSDAAAAGSDQPVDPLETQLAGIWAETLGIPAIGRLQNFYAQGADSLIMAQVAGKLRQMLAGPPFGVEIPFDMLFRQMLNNPNVAALAQAIRSQDSANRPVSAAAADERPGEQSFGDAALTYYGDQVAGPLRVVFHAGLGTLNCFRFLLPHLEERQLGPIVGVSVADSEWFCSQNHLELIEKLADDYAGRLLATGHQAMQLIGYCLGGLIAVEVARRLLEQGIHVADLVLVDSHPVLYEIDDDLLIEALFVPNLGITLEQAGYGAVNPDDFVRGLRRLFTGVSQRVPARAVLTIGGDAGLDRVGELFRRLAALAARERFNGYVTAVAKYNGARMPVEMAEGLYRVYRQSLKSANFRPRPYMGDIRFLLAREQFGLVPDTGENTLEYWRQICLGQFTVLEIDGNHLTCIETESNAKGLAKVIMEGGSGC